VPAKLMFSAGAAGDDCGEGEEGAEVVGVAVMADGKSAIAEESGDGSLDHPAVFAELPAAMPLRATRRPAICSGPTPIRSPRRRHAKYFLVRRPVAEANEEFA
jgi:hypothetical protein